MIIKDHVSLQDVSWVKSNKRILTSPQAGRIEQLLYPESYEEFCTIIKKFYKEDKKIELIGCSSNTLFLPTFRTKRMICTKRLDKWIEQDGEIICNAGVLVSKFVKHCVSNGYKGYEGLIDLPGTIASAIYGNSGCFGYLLTEKLKYIELIGQDGSISYLNREDLGLSFRSSALKRGEIKGIITKVVLDTSSKEKPSTLMVIANKIHQERLQTQPSAKNNLGTTININTATTNSATGKIFHYVWKTVIQRFLPDETKSFKVALVFFGKFHFTKYLWNIHRFMFYDEKSHFIFHKYIQFIKHVYPTSELEIEIKK